jgi:predicted lipoprotein with Yx(FWY)xxD motif
MLRSHFRITLAPGLFASLVAIVGLIGLAGCGSSGGGGLYGSNYGSNSGSNTNGSGGQTTCASSTAAICVRSVQVNGNTEKVLVNPSGKTLYYFTADSDKTVACTGSCVSNWPPLMTSSMTVAPIAGLTGKLATVSRSEGSQITYSGHPLYTYAGDAAPGDTKGEGVLGKWYVATPDLAPAGGYNSGY